MRTILKLLACSTIGLASATLAQDRGLAPSTDALGGPFWQSRFERDLPAAGWAGHHADALWLSSAPPQTLRLLGDYQFSALRLGETGGLRLTGGLLINLRSSGAPGAVGNDNGTTTLPYAGIGYASGGLRGDWGFSADLGLSAPGLGSLRLDRLVNGGGALAADGGLRLQPTVRLGMTLAF